MGFNRANRRRMADLGGSYALPALALMRERVAAIRRRRGELVWSVEHPPIYTAGTSAKPAELTEPDRFPTTKPAEVGSGRITGPASAQCMSCWTSPGRMPPHRPMTSTVTSTLWRNG